MVTNFKTNAGLIQRLEAAATAPKTKEELVSQRVSFVYGNLPADSTITRDRVAERIKQREGE